MKKQIITAITLCTVTAMLLSSCNKTATKTNGNVSSSVSSSISSSNLSSTIISSVASSQNLSSINITSSAIVISSATSKALASSKTVSKEVSSAASKATTTITKSEMKALLNQSPAPTFNDLKNKYDLQTQDKTVNTLTTSPRNNSEISLFFTNFNNKSDYSLNAISEPASLMFPQYVGMKIKDIPIVTEHNVTELQMHDSYGNYLVGILSNQNILSANDSISMSGN